MRTRPEIVLEALGLEVTARRHGRAWLPCPFHAAEPTRDPRFFVRLEGKRAGQCWCFSCKNGGSLYTLVEHIRGCDRKAALAFIEQALKGFRAPPTWVRFVERKPDLVRPGLYFPKGVVFAPLAAWTPSARRYFEGERGLSAAEVERYGLGYAADGYLAGRVVFPCRDRRDRIVSYSARTFVDEIPRYKTPHEEHNADRSAIFGEHLWPPVGARRAIVVTEGAVDAVSAAKVAGVLAGSIGGSAEIDPGQLEKLASFAVVGIMTDNDPAGNAAADVLRRALARHVETVRIELPKGSDANKLCRNDPELLRSTVAHAFASVANEGDD